MTRPGIATLMLMGIAMTAVAAHGQDGGGQQGPAAASSSKPDPLVIYFSSGSARIEESAVRVLDHASRLYREGNPIVMIISGSTDSVGAPSSNLLLSEKRDQSVLQGLVARGIPVNRFQLLAKGETDPKVATDPGRAERENRRVEITWR